MANFINLATVGPSSGGLNTPDGQPLIASHALYSGSYSNVITGNPPLSIQALEQAIQQFMQTPSYDGDYMPLDGPFNLLVPPSLYFLALRITESVRLPQSNNNDPNPAGKLIKEVIPNPFFTSPTAWALVAANEDENPLQMAVARSWDPQEEFDKGRDVRIYYATEIWNRMLWDWRGILYSAGQ